MPVKPEKINSHANWYHGKWQVDTCRCGEKMLVPIGMRGKYQCNTCASPSPEDGMCSENADNLGESPDY